MAQKRRFLDVWIVESNTVYREVPFMVVTDWVQQGRLLADDKVRPSGTAQWYPIGGSPTFAPYLPKAQEHRAEDQAEALEPVQVDFTWRRRADDEDDDVDMIPLIDISLVLLIFFMIVSESGYVFGGKIDIPGAHQKRETLAKNMKLWVGVDVEKDKEGHKNPDKRFYALGLGGEVLVSPSRDPQKVLDELEKQVAKVAKVAKFGDKVRVRIQADESVPIEVIKDMTVWLKGIQHKVNQKPPGKVQIEIVGEVGEARKRGGP
jgi:biopolymer transport protein ExbD